MMKSTLPTALLIWLLFGPSLFLAKTPQKGDSGRENLILPDAVVACTYVTPFVKDVDGLGESRCAGIAKSMNDAGAAGSGFSHLSYLVQTDLIGNVYGYVRQPGKTLEQSGVPFMGLLFVTEPVRNLDSKIVVIFSAVGPERTVIFTLDDSLQPKVIYDSFVPSPTSRFTPLGSVYQVRILGKGRLLLQERRMPGGETTAQSNRSFLLDINRGMKLTPYGKGKD